MPRLGRRACGRGLLGPGEHPRLGRDGRRHGRRVCDHSGSAARRAPDRLPCRRAGCRRRPPWPAVGGIARRRAGRWLCGPVRHPRRPPGRRSRTSGRGASPALSAPSRAVREDAARRLAAGRRRASRRDRGAARAGRLCVAGRLGRRREPRGARRWHRKHRSRRPRGPEECAVTKGFQLLRLDEIDGYAEDGRPRWHMIRSVLGIESFGINAWRATTAGQEIIGDHDELGSGAGRHGGLYFVLSGRATFTVEGEPVDAPAGSLVFVKDPAMRRGAVAEEAATEILVIGGRPGAAFSVSSWERSAEALRYWTTGDWDGAIDILND